MLSVAHLRALRVRANRISGPPARDVAATVRAVAAIPAQDTRASRLAIRPRSAGLTAEDVRHASDRERSVVRTWAMRGTLHMVATEDLGWALAALGPVFAAAGRPRRLALGLDDETSERGLQVLRDVLADAGPLPRAELARRVVARGVALDIEGQAPAHLISLAALHGVLCRGPEAEREQATYVLLDDWVGAPAPVDPEDALAELARRHLAAHGPASEHDLAAWSGVGVRRARAGLQRIAQELAEVRTQAGRAWALARAPAPDPDPDAEPLVRLLGAFDPYLLGHRGRDLILAPGFARRIQAGGGIIRPALLIDGRVAGTWRREGHGAGMEIAVEPFEPLDSRLSPQVDAERSDVRRFLGGG